MKKLRSSGLIVRKCVASRALLPPVACPRFGKRKDDVVIMKNGDKFTGEIKPLQYGELILKSDYMKDSVHLDWRQVDVLQSKDTFIAGLSNGERVTGCLGKKTNAGGDRSDLTIIAEGAAVSKLRTKAALMPRPARIAIRNPR